MPNSSVILNGWKDIAAFLGCSENSARRMADKEGLPVYRRKTKNGFCGVMASKKRLEAWLDKRSGKG